MSNQVFLLTLCRRRRCVFASFAVSVSFVCSLRSFGRAKAKNTHRTEFWGSQKFIRHRSALACSFLLRAVLTHSVRAENSETQSTTNMRWLKLCLTLQTHTHTTCGYVCVWERAKSIHQEKWWSHTLKNIMWKIFTSRGILRTYGEGKAINVFSFFPKKKSKQKSRH